MDEPLPLPRDLSQRVRRALDRISGTGSPEEVADLAEELFRGAYEHDPVVGRASVTLPLIAEHTRYFSGFGILMRLPGGIGVAARKGGGDVRVLASGEHASEIEALIERICDELAEADLHDGVEVAAVCAAPAGGAEAVLAAAGVALLEALELELPIPEASALITGQVEALLDRPCGPAHALASISSDAIVLIDAGTHEHVSIERPEALGAALLEVGQEAIPGREVFAEHSRILESALAQLRSSGFVDLGSLRRLEHQELPNALAIVDVRARPLLRHLVTEDRRVPRMVAALRRQDAQVVGALLLMSHASRRDDLQASTEEVEFILTHAETAEGVYGARMAGPGFGGRVLLVGRPFLLPDIVDRIAEQYEQRFDTDIRTTLL